MKNDSFTLYDLQVEVVGNQKDFVCGHVVGKQFEVHGENLVFQTDQKISLYALSALLPLLPAKQRNTDKNDWMTTDMDIACPDPNCRAMFRITRTQKRTFKHSEVTKTPLIRKENI